MEPLAGPPARGSVLEKRAPDGQVARADSWSLHSGRGFRQAENNDEFRFGYGGREARVA
jgi:hypothetical protein